MLTTSNPSLHTAKDVQLRRGKKTKFTDSLCNHPSLSCAPEEHPALKCAIGTDRESRSGAGGQSLEANQHLQPNLNGKNVKAKQSKEKSKEGIYGASRAGDNFIPQNVATLRGNTLCSGIIIFRGGLTLAARRLLRAHNSLS